MVYFDDKLLSRLTEKERLYLDMMQPQYGVLYLTSPPGMAKSVMLNNIANKLEINYFDVRLASKDETDLGSYPVLSDMSINGKTIKVLDFAIPKWAILANEKPCIVHFEELNRSSLPVRNAALQLLLERSIGTEFKFNSNVLMVASGNLGEEDDTDVDEFDTALNNRLIHVNHNLTYEEWIDSYANDNINKFIVDFIKANPEEYYRKSKENTPAYATPRSWTFLSRFIDFTLKDKKNNITYVKELIHKVASCYVGNSSMRLIRYMEESVHLSIYDIMDNFEKSKSIIEKFNRDKKSELMGNLKVLDLKLLNENQINNIVKFLHILTPDELVSYLIWILDTVYPPDLKKYPYEIIIDAFKPVLKKINSSM